MTDQKQALYDILGEAFKAGRAHAKDETILAADLLFPLAARMEAEVQKMIRWQPIETVHAAAAKTNIGTFIYAKPNPRRPGNWHVGIGYIAKSGAVCDDCGGMNTATHWMPLPSSPERET